MAAARTYTPEQRQAIHELVNDLQRNYSDTVRTLEAGYQEHPPFTISRDSVARIAKEERARERGDVERLELADALDTLGRQSLALIGQRLAQVEAKPAAFDAQEVLTIMRALTEAKGLVKSKKGRASTDEPTGLLGTLKVADTTTGPKPQAVAQRAGSLASSA